MYYSGVLLVDMSTAGTFANEAVINKPSDIEKMLRYEESRQRRDFGLFSDRQITCSSKVASDVKFSSTSPMMPSFSPSNL